MGVPAHKQYTPVFNTDAVEYGGDGFGDTEPVPVEAIESHGKEHSAAIRIPAFGAVFLRGEGSFPKPKTRKPADPGAKVVKTAKAAVKAAEKTAKVSVKAVGKTVKAVKESKAKATDKPARKPRAKKQAKELKET